MFVGSYNKFKDLDMFAKKMGLFYNGSEKIGTSFGLTLTIIYIIISLLIFIYYTVSIVRKEELQVNDSTEYSNETPFINLNNSDLFYFAFGVEKGDTATRFVDDTIYRARAVYYYGKKDETGTFNTIEYRDLNIEKCKVEKFGKNYQHLFTKGEFDDSYCVSNFDLALTGGFIYDEFSCIRILIYPCFNTTANNNHCKPQEEIDKALAGGYFSILLKDIGLNPNNHSSPILPTIQDFYTTISKDFYKDVIFNYEITDVISDDGLFYEKKNTERYLKYDRIKESFYFRNDTEYYYKGKSICKIEIRLSDNIHVQRRVYKKFANALSTTGGYMQMIYTIFMVFSLIPNKFKLETIIVNGLLNLSATNKEANLSLKYHLNKDDKSSKKSSLFIDNGKNRINKKVRNSNLNFNIDLERNSHKFNEQNNDNDTRFIRIKNNNKKFSVFDLRYNNLNNEQEKEKEKEGEKYNSFMDQSASNISKNDIFPKSTGFNIINPDNLSFSRGSNKFYNPINSNKNNNFTFNREQTKITKDMRFSILEYYFFGKCNARKKKKINTFNKCIRLYKEQMDIINIFNGFLTSKTNLFEKRTLNEEMKIFLKQTNIDY